MKTCLSLFSVDTVKISICFILVTLLKMSKTEEGKNQKQKLFSLQPENICRIHSMRCIVKDPSFIDFTDCSLKPINRTLKYINVRVKLYKPVLENTFLHFRVLKKANGGYKPFGIDVKLNICQYMDGRRNPIFDWIYNMALSYMNFNHTCPYYDSIMVNNFPTNRIKLPSVFPTGDYLVELKIDSYGQTSGFLNLFVDIMEN